MENFSLKERLGCEPSDDQLAVSLKMSLADLRSTLMECSLAREKLAMSNVRLVMSIAQRYDSMGTEMADLIQVTFTVQTKLQMQNFLHLCIGYYNVSSNVAILEESSLICM